MVKHSQSWSKIVNYGEKRSITGKKRSITVKIGPLQPKAFKYGQKRSITVENSQLQFKKKQVFTVKRGSITVKKKCQLWSKRSKTVNYVNNGQNGQLRSKAINYGPKMSITV